MNYLPLDGYWFYGSANSTELACYYSSYGLLRVAVPAVVVRRISIMEGLFSSFTEN